MYGWIIDIDHDPDPDAPEGTNLNAKGVVGPADIPDWAESCLRRGADTGRGATGHGGGNPGWYVYRFWIYDSDGELYYTGRMITDEGQTEEAIAGPLVDFGTPNAGASEICYLGHPEMKIN